MKNISYQRLGLRAREIGVDALLAPEHAREIGIGGEISVYLPPAVLRVLA